MFSYRQLVFLMVVKMLLTHVAKVYKFIIPAKCLHKKLTFSWLFCPNLTVFLWLLTAAF